LDGIRQARPEIADRRSRKIAFADVVREFVPNWFSVTMGTGVLALALNQIPLPIPVVHIVMFLVFTAIYAARWVFFFDDARRIFREPAVDGRIAEALDTSIANILRTRRQLVEEGFEAVLTRKYNPNSARARIFDGVAEAKLITLACGPAPEGHAKWSLRLLEEKVVELHIVERASDNTIGRTLKKTLSSRI
jgi:hypothetical protein